MKYLGNLQNKYYENNFNLIRFIAACLVMFTHSFALAISPDAEPLRDYIGMTLGKIAVDIFFVVSGFLLAKSIYTKNDILEYFIARGLRIFPLLWLVVLCTALILGPILTTVNLKEYFNLEVLKYIAINSSLLSLTDKLPGMFIHNPFPNAINGSLWTLPYEIRMYLILSGLWCLSVFSKYKLEKILVPFVAIIALLGFNFGVFKYMPGDPGLRLCWMFFLGGTFYLYRDVIPDLKIIYSIAILVISFFFYPDQFELFHFILTPYLVIQFGLRKTGFLSKFNSIGDGSYGIYILAFPVQQTIVSVGVHDPVWLFFYTTLIVIPLSYLSWWKFESKIMKFKLPIYNYILTNLPFKRFLNR